MATTVRLYRGTYEELKALRGDNERVEDVLRKVLRETTEDVVSWDESRVVAQPVDDKVAEQIAELAGENATANDVVRAKMEEFKGDDV